MDDIQRDLDFDIMMFLIKEFLEWLFKFPLNNIRKKIVMKISEKRHNHQGYLDEQKAKEENAEFIERQETQEVLDWHAEFSNITNNILEVKSKQRYQCLLEYYTALQNILHGDLRDELLSYGRDVLYCYKMLTDRPKLLSKQERRDYPKMISYIENSLHSGRSDV